MHDASRLVQACSPALLALGESQQSLEGHNQEETAPSSSMHEHTHHRQACSRAAPGCSGGPSSPQARKTHNCACRTPYHVFTMFKDTLKAVKGNKFRKHKLRIYPWKPMSKTRPKKCKGKSASEICFVFPGDRAYPPAAMHEHAHHGQARKAQPEPCRFQLVPRAHVVAAGRQQGEASVAGPGRAGLFQVGALVRGNPVGGWTPPCTASLTLLDYFT